MHDNQQKTNILYKKNKVKKDVALRFSLLKVTYENDN